MKGRQDGFELFPFFTKELLTFNMAFPFILMKMDIKKDPCLRRG